jgi:hypothetical protein
MILERKGLELLCATEDCRRTASEGEAYCETCSVERSLYRRETRGLATDASRSQGRADVSLRPR